MSDARPIVVAPTWFDCDGRDLAGWIHRPEGDHVTGGVVICGPLGRESIIAYPALRMLADDLARAGQLALRFDYVSTGNSTDHDGTHLVEPWLDSIAAATKYLRDAGCKSISLVGLRMGAALAAAAVSRCEDVRLLTLWDPCLSGNTFLREQRALQLMEIGHVSDREDGGREALGFYYASDTVSDLRQLKIDSLDIDLVTGTGAAARTVVLLARPEHETHSALAGLTNASGVIREVADEQDEFLGRRSFASVYPQKTVASIVHHIHESGTIDPHRVVLPTRTETVVGQTEDGVSIVEQLTTIGPRSLAAVVTETRPARSGVPTVICTNVAGEHLIGPGRAWVTFSRHAAASGVRAVRLDRSGVGDSASRDADAQSLDTTFDDIVMYTPDSGEEMAEVIREVRSSMGGAVGVLGSCSGAWLTAAGGSRARLDAAWLINLRTWAVAPDARSGAELGKILESVDRGELVYTENWKTRTKQVIKSRMPYRVWLALCKRGVVQAPEPLLADLAARGTRVYIHLAPVDLERFVEQRGPEGLKRLVKRGARIEVHPEPVADHALFGIDGRDQILDQVLAAALLDRDQSSLDPVNL